MNEIMQSRVSIGMHTVIAIAMGWLSIEIAAMSRSLFAIVAGLVILYITGTAAQRVTNQKGIKWWAANGLVVYLFIWFISWTVLFNLAL
jgi:hypothetical protein